MLQQYNFSIANIHNCNEIKSGYFIRSWNKPTDFTKQNK